MRNPVQRFVNPSALLNIVRQGRLVIGVGSWFRLPMPDRFASDVDAGRSALTIPLASHPQGAFAPQLSNEWGAIGTAGGRRARNDFFRRIFQVDAVHE